MTSVRYLDSKANAKLIHYLQGYVAQRQSYLAEKTRSIPENSGKLNTGTTAEGKESRVRKDMSHKTYSHEEPLYQNNHKRRNCALDSRGCAQRGNIIISGAVSRTEACIQCTSGFEQT